MVNVGVEGDAEVVVGVEAGVVLVLVGVAVVSKGEAGTIESQRETSTLQKDWEREAVSPGGNVKKRIARFGSRPRGGGGKKRDKKTHCQVSRAQHCRRERIIEVFTISDDGDGGRGRFATTATGRVVVIVTAVAAAGRAPEHAWGTERASRVTEKGA